MTKLFRAVVIPLSCEEHVFITCSTKYKKIKCIIFNLFCEIQPFLSPCLDAENMKSKCLSAFYIFYFAEFEGRFFKTPMSQFVLDFEILADNYIF